MPADVTLACVGKPSAGKSSFLNAVTDASAKVGTSLRLEQSAALGRSTGTTNTVLIRCYCHAGCLQATTRSQPLSRTMASRSTRYGTAM